MPSENEFPMGRKPIRNSTRANAQAISLLCDLLLNKNITKLSLLQPHAAEAYKLFLHSIK